MMTEKCKTQGQRLFGFSGKETRRRNKSFFGEVFIYDKNYVIILWQNVMDKNGTIYRTLGMLDSSQGGMNHGNEP
jgi:hypothetical protein